MHTENVKLNSLQFDENLRVNTTKNSEFTQYYGYV